jgi:hypothetical protein
MAAAMAAAAAAMAAAQWARHIRGAAVVAC